MPLINENYFNFINNRLFEESMEGNEPLEVVGKVKENFDRFKKHANNKFEKYVEFVNNIKESKENHLRSFQVDKVYTLYDGDYSVALYDDETNGIYDELAVFGHEELEENNPIYTTSDKEAVQSYKAFYAVLKDHISEIKNQKKSEIEQEKLKGFLKESKRK